MKKFFLVVGVSLLLSACQWGMSKPIVIEWPYEPIFQEETPKPTPKPNDWIEVCRWDPAIKQCICYLGSDPERKNPKWAPKSFCPGAPSDTRLDGFEK